MRRMRKKSTGRSFIKKHEVTSGLPNHTLGIPGSSETKRQGEITPISCSDVNYQDLGVQIRESSYTEGEVKFTTPDVLRCMAQNLPNIRQETGCIIDETCYPVYSKYIPEEHFKSLGKLGHGSYGLVDVCRDTRTKKDFVRKTIEKSKFKSIEAIAPTILNHPNITKLFGIILRDNANIVELLLEYGGQSLREFIKGKLFNDSEICYLAKQGLEGLKHMHSSKIIHMDIKAENICILEVNGSVLLKITDFGSSRLPAIRLEIEGVTRNYMAPELCKYWLQLQKQFCFDWGLSQDDITGAVDVYAFALVIMYMYKGYHIIDEYLYVVIKRLTGGQTTYKNLDANRKISLHFDLMIEMAKDDEEFFVQKYIPDVCSSIDMRELLNGMTQRDHTRRCTAKEACNYIEDVEKRSLQCFNTNEQIPRNLPQSTGYSFNSIPADDRMKREPGPMKNKYGNNGEDSHGVASNDLQISTPVSDFEKSSLEQLLHKQQSLGATARSIPIARSPVDTSPNSFLDIHDKSNYLRLSVLDNTWHIITPIHVPTPVESMAYNERSRGEQSALPKNRMVHISAESSSAIDEHTPMEISPPVPSDHEEYTPMEESPSVPGNIPNFNELIN